MGLLGLTPDYARQDVETGVGLAQRLEMQWKERRARDEARKEQGNWGDDGQPQAVETAGPTPDFNKLAEEMYSGERDSNGYVGAAEDVVREHNTAKYERQVQDAELATQAMRETSMAQQRAVEAAAPGPDQSAPPVDIYLGAAEDAEAESDEDDETWDRRRKQREAFGGAGAGIKI